MCQVSRLFFDISPSSFRMKLDLRWAIQDHWSSSFCYRMAIAENVIETCTVMWAASSEFGNYRLCEQRGFRRACASAQSRQNLRCSLIQAVSQEEPSGRKPDPWLLWMAGHAQLKFVMTECSKTQIRLTRHNCNDYGLMTVSILSNNKCNIPCPSKLKIFFQNLSVCQISRPYNSSSLQEL